MTRPAPWNLLSTLSRTTNPWVCRECLRTSQKASPVWPPQQALRTFSQSAPKPTQAGKRAWRERIKIQPKERRKVAIAATLLFVAGSGALAVSDRARHAYGAVERSGRVGVTLALCVNDYRKTLKQAAGADYAEQLSRCHTRCAQRTLDAMERNGSIFVKLGQHLSSLNYVLPGEWCDTFVPLQDRCPVSSFGSIEEMVRRDTGHSLEHYFSEFDSRPIGAASLAQVHVARMKGTGEKVAVKVQHPALDEWAKLDLTLTRFTFRTLKRFFPEYDLTWLSEEMEVSLPKELNFEEEGRNATRAREYFSHIRNTPLVIPRVVWAQRRILVMEYITGHRPDDLEYLDSNGIDRDEVSAALARIFNEMIFGTNAPLHCDPHGGNLAIRLNASKRAPRNFDVILYDHGLYRDIPLALRRNYAKLWLAVLNTDEAGMRQHAFEVAGIGAAEFPLFASAITGRDYSVVQSSVAVARKPGEKQAISAALGEGLLEQLVRLLARLPRVILLILKTNDLTRSLDEKLQTRQGPARGFLILARYAARTVYQERVEGIRGSLLWPGNMWRFGGAVVAYAGVAAKLRLYEMYLSARRRLGMEAAVV